MITIENYLLEIYKDFREYVENTEDLCLLKTLHYQAGQVPNYSNIHIQQLYLLRYIFSYAFEYKEIFLDLFRKENIQNNISLASIGCGSMIDYWSLVKSLEEIDHYETSIVYRGIDVIDWKYKIVPRERDDMEFKQGNILSLIDKSTKFISDIYFFPKSISEFSPKEFARICDAFRENTFLKDKIHILISLRSDNKSMCRDMDRSQEIVTAMKQNGFTTKDKASTYKAFNNKERGIRKLDYTFEYPDKAKQLLQDLALKCKKLEKCNKDCEEYLNRWPILTLRNICYQIFTFNKED